MDDNEIIAIVGWPTEPEMAKYRKVAAVAVAAERERCATLCESKSANGNWRVDTRHECASLIRGVLG